MTISKNIGVLKVILDHLFVKNIMAAVHYVMDGFQSLMDLGMGIMFLMVTFLRIGSVGNLRKSLINCCQTKNTMLKVMICKNWRTRKLDYFYYYQTSNWFFGCGKPLNTPL